MGWVDNDMTKTWTDLEPLQSQATRYFDRPGFSMPAYLGDSAVAILDDRSGVPQVSVLDTTSLEVAPLTAFSERVLTLLGTRGGHLVFGMDTGGDERQQVWRRSPDDGVAHRLTHRPDSIHEPGALSVDGTLALVKSNARDEAIFDIVGVNLATGELTPWLENAGNASPVALSRNGQRALVIRANSNLDADLLLLDRGDGSTRNLTSHEGEAWILGASFSPDEESAYLSTNEGEEFCRLERLHLESGQRCVVVEEAWDVEAFAVSPDGRRVIVAFNEAGASRVEVHDLVNGAPPIRFDSLERGTVDRFSWSPDGTHVAFGHSTAEIPSRIVLASMDGTIRIATGEGEERRPTTTPPQLVRFQSFDGLEVSGFLFRPEGAGPFPVLIEVHGGPESQRRLQYSSAIPTNQFICSLGIAVLALNVRGSTGYGKSFSHLDDRERRLDAVRDVAAAVDWLRGRDEVIGDRIGIMGQSYGGFMTLASIALHPDLWAAAVDVVGIANFVTFLERTGPWRRAHRSQEYGWLEHDRELLERISPLTHVDAIEAPLFVIHGRNDPRVPLHEAEQIVSALEQRGRPVELRVFDNEGHGLARRENRIAGYAEAARFLARYLLG